MIVLLTSFILALTLPIGIFALVIWLVWAVSEYVKQQQDGVR